MIEKISYDQVNESAANLIKSSQNMKDVLDQVEQKMQKVNTEDTWKSDAAEEMYNNFKALSKKFESFHELVNSYGKFLNNTVDTYKTADLAIKKKEEELLHSEVE